MKKKEINMKKLFLLSSIVLLGACGEKNANLRGNAYQYTLNNVPIIIAFDKNENRYFGKVVNNYFGTYTQNGGELTLHLGGSTMMIGPANEMAVEQTWLETLPTVTKVTQTKTGIILTLKDGTKINLKKTAMPK